MLAGSPVATHIPRVMSTLTRDYDYALPDELIARRPPERREDARMLLVERHTGRIEHRQFAEFPSLLRAGDLAVLNDTRVVPARVFSNDGKIELLVMEQSAEGARCMVRPGRKMRAGAEIVVGGERGVVREVLANGERMIAFAHPLDLAAVGKIPLPPYMDRGSDAADAERYQTVFAREPGAVAAPTAGLHFTPEILARIPHAFVTLHVGAGTFRPVQVEDIAEHTMHTERYAISPETASVVAEARRVVAIGTTSVRVLESCAREHGKIEPCSGATDIFIHPPFDFRVTGALLTNFHLPRSTLLMLVSAFAGRELVLEAYREAIAERYRFYSYGDCMLLI